MSNDIMTSLQLSCDTIVMSVYDRIHKLPAVEELVLHPVLPCVYEDKVRGPPWDSSPLFILAARGRGEEGEGNEVEGGRGGRREGNEVEGGGA